MKNLTRFNYGIILLLVSYGQLFLPSWAMNFWILSPFVLAFMAGIAMICDGLTLKLSKRSLLNEIFKSRSNTIAYVVAAVCGGIMLDGVSVWMSRLWFYPFYDNFFIYLIFFVPGFTVYWLMIAESYLAVKAVIDSLRKGKKIVKKCFPFEPVFYKILLVLGVVLFLSSSFLIFLDYGIRDGYFFNINTNINYRLDFTYLLYLFLGFWFILEFVEYVRRKTSLLKDILHDYLSPILAILIAGFILAVLQETQNFPVHFWIYINWPLQEIKFLGLPIMVFAVWPLQYIAFLSLFRAMTNKESEDIWNGDAIA